MNISGTKPRTVATLVMGIALLAGCSKDKPNTTAAAPADNPDNVVNFYMWANYMAPDTLETFTKRTGIKVKVTYFDTFAVPETRLLTGRTGFDVVVAAPPFLRRLIKSGVFQPLDKRQLPNIVNLDPALTEKLTADDPGNLYGVIYGWGTNGLTYNEKQLAGLVPKGAMNSWNAVFDPASAARVARCFINSIDTPAAVVPIALAYLGRNVQNPTSQDLNDVDALLGKLRPNIHNIDSGGMIDAMANGDACVAIDSNGNAFQARRRAKEAQNGVTINYAIPAEGSLLWFDVLAIPSDAPHVVNAHRLINYFLDPKVSADITNFVGTANANLAATSLLDPSIRSDAMVYPPPDTLKRLAPWPEYTPEQSRLITRLWQKFKTGQ